MKKIYLIIAITLFTSCSVKKKEIEYLQFEHRCIIKRKSDQVLVSILPFPKNKRLVETNHQNKATTKFIGEKEYYKIVDDILKIKKEQKDSTIVFTDGSINTITYRKGSEIKTFTSEKLSKEYPSFYYAVKSILESAGIYIDNIR